MRTAEHPDGRRVVAEHDFGRDWWVVHPEGDPATVFEGHWLRAVLGRLLAIQRGGSPWLREMVLGLVREQTPRGWRCRCRCCGYLTLTSVDQYDICSACGWEDDPTTIFAPGEGKGPGPNHVSLTEGRRNQATEGTAHPWLRDEAPGLTLPFALRSYLDPESEPKRFRRFSDRARGMEDLLRALGGTLADLMARVQDWDPRVDWVDGLIADELSSEGPGQLALSGRAYVVHGEQWALRPVECSIVPAPSRSVIRMASRTDEVSVPNSAASLRLAPQQNVDWQHESALQVPLPR